MGNVLLDKLQLSARKYSRESTFFFSMKFLYFILIKNQALAMLCKVFKFYSFIQNSRQHDKERIISLKLKMLPRMASKTPFSTCYHAPKAKISDHIIVVCFSKG